jgi:paraquat-inducible protein A
VVRPELSVGQDGAVDAELLACPECDLLQRAVELPPRAAAVCRRCGAVLYRELPDWLDRTLAYTLGAAILFVVANAFPIVTMEMQGHHSSTTLIGAALALHRQDMTSVALLMLATTVLLPAVQIAAMLVMLLPLRFGRASPGLPELFRVVSHVRPWAMVEVFLLGALVSLAKLAHLAHLTPDVALWSFGALIVLLACAASAFDERAMWRRLERMEQEVAA